MRECGSGAARGYARWTLDGNAGSSRRKAGRAGRVSGAQRVRPLAVGIASGLTRPRAFMP
ncbi:hypothetical protein WT12_12840 [Burkholderia territorii]|nr:hypothetical protein WT12_12840 [Burkholderia territorii]